MDFLTSNPLASALFSALFGILAGAAITWKMTHWFDKRRNAADLYSQFVSFDMEKTRHIASHFLINSNKSSEPLSYEMMHAEDYVQYLSDVTRLLNFWEKTEHFLELRHVDHKFTKVLLQNYFHAHMNKFLADFCLTCEEKDSGHFIAWTRNIRRLESRWEKQ